MKTKAFDIVIRRLCTGCDFHIRLFALDADKAMAAATDRARFVYGITPAKYALLTGHKGVAVFRVVSCAVSEDQSRPVV